MLTGSSAGSSRVLERLERLFEIGGGKGANRPAYSAEEQEAHDLVGGWMRAAGLEVSVDPAGNLYGRLPGSRPELPEVWSGSHLDTVPDGGRFDGALGVVATLETVERLAAEPRGERTLCVVAFRDEEGWRFGRGFFGSRALCGLADPDDLSARDAGGVSMREALAALGLGEPPLDGWLEPAPAAFVELHVEQGPVLAERGAPLGLVTGIAAMARGDATFTGSAAHAGTTPMRSRADALCAAAEFVLAARDAAETVDGAVATVGQLTVEPGASNVVPGWVRLTVDARAPDRERLDAVLARIRQAGDLDVRTHDPIPMAPGPSEALRREVDALGVPFAELPSGGGHDAGILASAGVPTAMLFVRSLAGGASHSPAEETSAGDIELALSTLTGALRRLGAGESLT